MGSIKNISLLSWMNFFTDFVFFAPVAIIYFSKVTGSMALGMSIISAAYVSSALFEIPTGIISDIVGRKKTTVLGALTSVICTVLYAMAGSYWVLFLGAVFQGISRSFYSGNNDALLHDSLKESGQEKQYHAHLGRTSSMFQFALAIASVTGSFMAAKSFALVMWASVIPQICALVVALQLVKPTVDTKGETNIFAHLGESVKQWKRNSKLRYLTAAAVIKFALGESSFFMRSAFINTIWPLWAIGISRMLSHISGAFSFYYSGKIIDKYNPIKILNFEIIFNRIVNLTALIFPTVVSPLLMASTSLTYGVGTVATNSLLQKEFTQRQRATMGSLNSFAGSMVFGVFSIFSGYMADLFGPGLALILSQILQLIPLYFYRKIFIHDQKKECTIFINAVR